MPYTKTTWAAADVITAAKLNNLETQHDGAIETLTGAIDKLVASSASVVDVFLYDTTKDSDGGAWRKRCQHLSWYNETLNTSTRGATKEFPALALIVLTSTTLTIYDATTPTLPLWKQGTGFAGVTALHALNGSIYVGNTTGLFVYDYLADLSKRYQTTGLSVARGIYTSSFPTASGTGIVNNSVNDVAATVLAGAPTDPATGLPVPTVAVATAGGLSIIHNDGTVVNSGLTNPFDDVSFSGDTLLGAYEGGLGYDLVYRNVGSLGAGFTYSAEYVAGGPIATQQGWGRVNLITPSFLVTGGGDPDLEKLCFVKEDTATPANGMVAYVTKDYTSGYLPGDIRRAWLANSATADRSVKNKPLTQVGTLTAATVATGADLMGYSGFSALDYLEEPYSSDLDFGTGDFAIFGWLKENPNTAGETILRRAGSKALEIKVLPDGKLRFDTYVGASIYADSPGAIDDGTWHLIAAIRRSGVAEVWIDGTKVASVANTHDMTDVTAATTVGTNSVTDYLTNGTLALWRATAYAPTVDQIRAIYEAERHLFVDNAKALLGGTSNAVQALAYDEDTQLLYVGTGDGTSVFNGLRRVNYLDEAGTTTTSDTVRALSAARGAVAIGTAAETSLIQAARQPREEARPMPNLKGGTEDVDVKSLKVGGVDVGSLYMTRPDICVVYKAASFSAAVSAITTVSFDAELIDTSSMHDNATNNSRITIQKAGAYRLEAILKFTNAANAAATELQVMIYKNGSTQLINAGINVPTAIDHTVVASAYADLVVGDYIEVKYWVSRSGVTIEADQGSFPSGHFAVQQIR